MKEAEALFGVWSAARGNDPQLVAGFSGLPFMDTDQVTGHPHTLSNHEYDDSALAAALRIALGAGMV